MSKNVFSILLILIFIFVGGCEKPQPTQTGMGMVDTLAEPVQIALRPVDKIVKKLKNGEITITTVAKYKVSGKVMRRKSYSEWIGNVVRIFDLVLIWGKLAEPENEKYFIWREGLTSGWTYKPEGLLDNSYITAHLGRYYVYPASDNITRAMGIVKKKQKISLEGFLINTKLNHKGRIFVTEGRLGSGWCKLFYVTKLRIANNLYE